MELAVWGCLTCYEVCLYACGAVDEIGLVSVMP